MLECSISYRDSLLKYCREANLSKYSYRRFVNWTYHLNEKFYSDESDKFLMDSFSYLEGDAIGDYNFDAYNSNLEWKVLIKYVAKIFIHLIFMSFGKFQLFKVNLQPKVRKAYVDDTDMTYGKNNVQLLIFPFPLSIKRQCLFLIELIRTKRKFVLFGNHYSAQDLLKLLCKRDFDTLIKIEARAQMRTVYFLKSQEVAVIELSDEYDPSMLDFCRLARRKNIYTINKTHGVGIYAPFQKFDEFYAITNKQISYYLFINTPSINKFQLPSNSSVGTRPKSFGDKINNVVLISQVGPAAPPCVEEEELKVYSILSSNQFLSHKLYYKPHPNNKKIPDYVDCPALNTVRHLDGENLYLSLYSTAQLDPAFDGEKYLIETDLIKPSIIFDDENIIHISVFSTFLERKIAS